MGLLDILTGRGRSLTLGEGEMEILSAQQESQRAYQEAVRYRQELAQFREVSGSQLYASYKHGRALRRPWSQQSAIRKASSASAWAYICIDARASAAASVPMIVQVRRRVNGEMAWVQDGEHPLQKLLRQPNPQMTWQSLAYVLYFHYVASREAYIGKTRAGFTTPQELWPLSPADLSPVLGASALISHYEHTVDGQRQPDQPTEDIVRWVLPDPSNPARGLSPILVGQDAVEVDRDGRRWQRASLSNGVVPSGVVEEPKGSPPLDPVSFLANKRTMENAHQGASNARGLLYLDGGRTFRPLAMSNVELDLVKSLGENLKTILALFHTPGPVVGLYETATYNNVTTAWEQFWKGPVLSDVRGMAKVITAQLAPEYGDDIRVVPDTSGVYHLNLLTPETMATAKGLKEIGTPPKEINRRLSLGLEPWEGWERPLVLPPAPASAPASEGDA